MGDELQVTARLYNQYQQGLKVSPLIEVSLYISAASGF